MSFRRRMVLLAAGAVAASVVLASVVVYVVTDDELHVGIDNSLRAKLTPGLPQSVQILTAFSKSEMKTLRGEGRLPPATSAAVGIGPTAGGAALAKALPGPGPGKAVVTETVTYVNGRFVSRSRSRAVPAPGGGPTRGGFAGGGGRARLVLPAQGLGGAAGYAQLSQPNGQLLRSEEKGLLPVTAATRAVAAGKRNAFFSDQTIGGTPVRVLTARATEGGVWQVALPLTDVDNTLNHLRLVLAIVSLGGIALAAALGLLVSRAALVPVRRLTGAAERVARTQDLGHRIETGSEDELGRLSTSFNTMLAALESARLAQRQLVSDASHELRTPLTSVQANLDALALGARLPERERERILSSAQAQLRELTVLVGDLVDLSKSEVEQLEVEDVRLDLAVSDAVARARVHAPQCRIELISEPCLVRAAPGRLDRALANLLDNAVKWNPPSPPAGPVQLSVHGGIVEVRDHGPGIAEEDLPRVFERFYRSPSARGRPGSGLGLAIVRQTAESHGGSVHAGNNAGGGARLTLELPQLAMTEAELAGASVQLPVPDAGTRTQPGSDAPEAALRSV